MDWGEDDKGREIYYEIEVPSSTATGFGSPGPGRQPQRPSPFGPPDDDFGDLLDQDENSAGLDLA